MVPAPELMVAQEAPNRRRLGRRLGVGVIDQAVCGSTNVMITLIAARELDPQEFGLFGIVYVVYLLSMNGLRSVVSEPGLVQSAERNPGAPISSALLLAGVMAVVVTLVAFVMGGSLRLPLLALAILLPALVVQDVGRYLAFAERRQVKALRLDLIWLVLQVAGLVALYIMDRFSVVTLIMAWGGAGGIAGVSVLWSYRAHDLGFSLAWIRQTWGFSWRYLVSYTSTFGVAYVVTLVLGAVSGAAAVGALRGAQVLLSPLVMMFTASVNVLAVDISRNQTGGDRLRSQMARVSMAMVIAAGVTCIVSLLVPHTVGRLLLGESWGSTRSLLLPAGIQAVLIGARAGAKIGMVGLRAVRECLALDLQVLPFLLVLPIVGALLDDASGFLWALVISQVLATLLWWRRFLIVGNHQDWRVAITETPA